MSFAARDHVGAVLGRVGHVLLNLFERVGIDQRTLLHTGLEARADLQLRRFRGKFLHELVVDFFVRVKTIGADARLTRIPILRSDRPLNRGIDLGIVEHDKRRVASELERQFLQGRRALLHQNPTDCGGPGK